MTPLTCTILRGDEKPLDAASRKLSAFNVTVLGSRRGFAAFGVIRDTLSVPCLNGLYRLCRRPGSVQN